MSRPALASPAPSWEELQSRWPNAGASRFVTVGGIAWHLQVAGAGPVLLLVHGTGSASFSWGAVLPLLARRFTVVVPDLPGHGFTSAPSDVHLTLVRKVLQSWGYLFLGGAETTINLGDTFERVQFDKAGCYRIKGS